MTDKPNWAEAPDDATHWSPLGRTGGEAWRKRVDGDWMRYVKAADQWRPLTDSMPETYIPRPGIEQPAPPTWDSQGLPPVGIVCERLWGQGVYYDVLILAHDEGMAVYRWMHGERKGEYSAGCEGFRPILTAEQRAAAERREAIAAMLSVPGVFNDRGTMEALYDAGYRKQ